MIFSILSQDQADRVLEAMNSDALDERLQVEFVSKLWCALFRVPAMLS